MYAEEVKLIWNSCSLFHIMLSSFITVNVWRQFTASWLKTYFIDLYLFSRMAAHYFTLVLLKEDVVFLVCLKTGMSYEEANERGSSTECVVLYSCYSLFFYIIYFYDFLNMRERERRERGVSYIWPGLPYLIKRFLFILFKFYLFWSVTFLYMLILFDYEGYIIIEWLYF